MLFEIVFNSMKKITSLYGTKKNQLKSNARNKQSKHIIRGQKNQIIERWWGKVKNYRWGYSGMMPRKGRHWLRENSYRVENVEDSSKGV